MTGTIDYNKQLALVEAQIQSEFMYTNAHAHTISEILYRNVDDFVHGNEIRIPTIGDGVITTWDPDNGQIETQPLQTGEILFRLTDFTASGWSVRDNSRNYMKPEREMALLRHHNMEWLRLYKERTETRLLETAYAAQIPNDPNVINGQPHRIVATGGSATDRTIKIEDLRKLRVSMQKAYMGRALILLVDAVGAEQLKAAYTPVIQHDSNPQIQGLLNNGSFTSDHTYEGNFYGWNVFQCEFLPDAVDTTDGTTAINVVAGREKKAAMAFCLQDDNSKALIYQEREAPKVLGDYKVSQRLSEYTANATQAFGIARVDSIGSIIYHA